MKITKYWRLKRDDKELDDFMEFIKLEINYIEKSKREHMYPSRVAHYDLYNKRIEKDTIIVQLTTSLLLSISNTFSTGRYTNENGEVEALSVIWVEDEEKKISNFSTKLIRQQKLKKLKLK